MSSDNERYAIYWAPDADHPLWAAGCGWLGRDPSLAAEAAVPGALRPNTAAAARYGFHATLKAPLRLAPGASHDALRRAVAALARRHRVFEMPTLEVAWLQDFLALRPVAAPQPAHPLRRLADACVAELDEFRAAAPPRPDQVAAADAAGLALLARWGYAHVFDAWRFHMTLSDRFPDRSSGSARQFELDARAWFSRSLAEPLRCTALSIFHEAAPGRPLQLVERLPLEGAA